MAILKDLIVSGVSRFIGSVFGSKFVVNGGTSSQFLKADGSLDGTTYCANNDSRLNNSRPASDVYSWAKASTKPSYTANEVGAIANTINTTWANLKSLRDNSTLKAGQWYRITDYVTTTIQANTQSAGHQFDIIVRADDVNVLNENAFAAKHSGDTYFSTAGAKLEAWELKYCLDNDDERFLWADTTNGKGVIWWMKDEHENECSYDFKNIQFKRWLATVDDERLVDTFNGKYCLSRLYDGETGAFHSVFSIDDGDWVWRYTFHCTINGDEEKDATLVTSNDGNCICIGNVIKEAHGNYDDDRYYKKIHLNDIVFCNTYDGDCGNVCFGNKIGYGCFNITFLSNCHHNTIDDYCYYNTIGNRFQYNSIGNYSSCNAIGDDFYDNTIGNCFQQNIIRNSCSNNSIGNNFYANYIGGAFQYNSIGNDIINNTIGNSCVGNSIGNSCNSNSIGDAFQHNSIGIWFRNTTIGSYFKFSSIGNYCQQIRIQKNYINYIIIENGNKYIDVTSTQTTSKSSALRNFTIAQGCNSTTTRKTISHNTVNDAFQTVYKPANSVEVSV